MKPSDPVYCEQWSCRMTYATCEARRKDALKYGDWGIPGSWKCLLCDVGGYRGPKTPECAHATRGKKGQLNTLYNPFNGGKNEPVQNANMR